MTETPVVVQDIYNGSSYRGTITQRPGKFLKSRIYCYLEVTQGKTIVASRRIGTYGSSFLDGPGLAFGDFAFTPQGLEILVAPTLAMKGLCHHHHLNGTAKRYCIPRKRFDKKK